MILNLDKKFTPLAGREINFESFTFSGGEPHIKISQDFDITQTVTITHRLNSFNDVGLLCIAVDALRRMQVEKINLFIPYYPAARQDRVMVKGEPLTAKVGNQAKQETRHADSKNKIGKNFKSNEISSFAFHELLKLVFEEDVS